MATGVPQTAAVLLFVALPVAFLTPSGSQATSHDLFEALPVAFMASSYRMYHFTKEIACFFNRCLRTGAPDGTKNAPCGPPVAIYVATGVPQKAAALLFVALSVPFLTSSGSQATSLDLFEAPPVAFMASSYRRY